LKYASEMLKRGSIFSKISRAVPRTMVSLGLGVVSQLSRAQHTVPDLTPSPINNITKGVLDKVGRNLHLQAGHPVCTIKNIIFDHINSESATKFATFDNFVPYVSTKANFDDLLFPADHPGRSPTDTYYVNDTAILRPHTSAHQTELLRSGTHEFLVAGDCYRRDEIDASHYPVFHQMEGVRVFDPALLPAGQEVEFVTADLKRTLESVARRLFGADTPMRWIDAYFPFTEPSMELEVEFNGKWLEVLGCGKVHAGIMSNVGLGDRHGWAFGLGLDRLAMILFGVPDIRLFWSTDPRFIGQFKAGEITAFAPFSKYPASPRDVSFWYEPAQFHDNDFFAVVREAAGDCVENVELVSQFVHPKSGRHSKMFRIHYRSLERTLLNEEVNAWQENVRAAIAQRPGIELR